MHVMGMQVCVHKWVPGNRQGRVAMISSGGSEHEASEQAQIVHPLFFLPTEGITRQFFCFSFSYSFYLRSQLACDHTVHRLMKQTLKHKKKRAFIFLPFSAAAVSPPRTGGVACSCSGGQGGEPTSFVRQRCRFAHALSTDLPSEAGSSQSFGSRHEGNSHSSSPFHTARVHYCT